MEPRVRLETADPDLGLTIILWLGDLLQAYGSSGNGRVVVTDETLIGLPFRRGPHRAGQDFRAWQDHQHIVHLACTSSSVILRRRPLIEAFRKARGILGAGVDWTSVDQLQVVRHQKRIRRLASRALGLDEPEPPARFLLRVDDFPSPLFPSEQFLAFHEIAAAHGLPYLLAVTPFLERETGRVGLLDAELKILHRAVREGAELALHGFTHRSRYRNYASELLSMPAPTLRRELERAENYLREQGLRTTGFVAPFNSYDPFNVSVLAERYELLCGGPESVTAIGYRLGPSFFMQRLYVPSYRFAYDVQRQGLGRFDQLIGEAGGLIVPITLHWANEVKTNFASFRLLCGRLAGHTLSWTELLGLGRWAQSVAETGA